MTKRIILLPILAVFILVLIQVRALARNENLLVGGGLTITDTTPAARSLTNSPTTSISITFDRALNPATVTSATFMAFGKWSGRVSGTISFTNGDQTAILTPEDSFFTGEMVMIVLSEQIQANDGSFLPSGGHSFQFWIASEPGSMTFSIIDTLSTRSTPGGDTVAYGGVATDYNGDGWADLTIVNELTADLRVFLNMGDGSGLFYDFIEPTFPVAPQASPSDPGDFNGDGHADIAVADIAVDKVSILLGNGDGTFAPQQQVNVGISPRGIAVLDVDGDGDADIVNTNAGGAGNLSLLLNNGSGVFGAPTFFEGGGDGEWGLAAADMDEDGRLDLVVGMHNSATVVTHRNNGDGTFTIMDTQASGGGVWMLGTGDVNGDGHEDVHIANNNTSTGAILLGDGAGNLAAPTTYPTDSFTIATDLGDVDGDGDLDWITSSYSGDWRLFLNNGNGVFTFNREFASTNAASCALFLDIDNDGDLDLALIDEVADTVQIARQNGSPGATPTPSPTASVTPTLTPSPTITATEVNGTPASPTPSLTPDLTPSPTPDPKMMEKVYLPVIKRIE